MSLRTVVPRRAPSLAPWALTLLVGSFAALAQPKPALVKDANEPGLNPYVEAVQLEQNTTSCQPASPPFSSCSFVLSTVSAGKRRVITYASASFFMSPGGTFPEVFLGSTGGGYVQLPLQPVQSGTVADRQLVSTPVTFYIEPGESPRFTLRGFEMLDSRTATLTLSGYHVNLP